MPTTQPYFVNFNVNGKIVGSCEVLAESPKAAAEIIGQSLTLHASKFYGKISPSINGVAIKENTMNNENTQNDTPEEKPSITSMHEVTPEDKETQEGLEDVEVGEVVPMSPAAAEQDKGLRPDLA